MTEAELDALRERVAERQEVLKKPRSLFPRKSNGKRERVIQAEVLAYLSSRDDLYFWRQNVSAGVAPSGQYMRSGVKGTPDIFCVKDGKIYGFELKREKGGKVSKDQQMFGSNLTAAGGIYVVVTSVDQVMEALGPRSKAITLMRTLRIYPR